MRTLLRFLLVRWDHRVVSPDENAPRNPLPERGIRSCLSVNRRTLRVLCYCSRRTGFVYFTQSSPATKEGTLL